MTTPEDQRRQGSDQGSDQGRAADDEAVYLHPSGGVVGKAFDAVPPEVQAMLNVKPGRTAARIQQVIRWAAGVDPEVLRQHQRFDKNIHTLDDIRDAPVRRRDQVAERFAAQYRHRAALTGAIAALPGGLWALVGAGADVQLTAVYAVRMAAKVAQSYGYDTTAVEEQARLADVLALAAGIDSLRGVGNWLTREGLVELLPQVLPRVLARVSIELSSEEAAKLVGRLIPGVGAVVGGAIDYAFLRAAGERAIAYYHNRSLSEQAVAAAPPTVALPPGEGSPREAASASDFSAGGAGMTVAPATSPATSPATDGALAATAVATREPLPVTPETAPAKSPVRQPRRWALYLAIFVVFVVASTIVACVALGAIITSALHIAQ